MELPRTWFKIDGLYYAASSLTNHIYSLCQADPERKPTPAEICEVFNNSKDLGWLQRELLIETGIVYKKASEEIPNEDLEELPAGVYSRFVSCTLGEGLRPMDLRSEKAIQIGNTQALLEKDIRVFLENRGAYDKLGITYKRGFLLYGPPGNGKSCILRNILQQLITEHSAIVIFADEIITAGTIQRLQQDPRLKIIVFEELTELFSNKSDTTMQKVLSFLDGEHSIPNTIVFATTNYAGSLPANLIRRPGRFDRLLRFDDPDAATRGALLEHYGEEATLEKVEATKGLSIAAIQEIVRRSQLYGVSLIETIEDFNRQCEIAEKDFGESIREAVGFSGSNGCGC